MVNGESTPGPRGRRNREGDVLEAAIDVFSRKSFAGSTVQDVAEAVGMLKGSLYYYIDSKDDLLFRILDRAHGEASGILAATKALDEEPLVRLRIYLERYVVFFLENIRTMTLYVREWRYLDETRKDRIIAQMRDYEEFVEGLIGEARERGDVPQDVDPKYATFFIIGAMTSLPDWYRPEGRETPEEIAERYADLALRSISAGR
jgi:AcrR family transcriptional regulator